MKMLLASLTILLLGSVGAQARTPFFRQGFDAVHPRVDPPIVGAAEDLAPTWEVIAELDGDGESDLVVWRASNGTWYWLTASGGFNPANAGSRQRGRSGYGDSPLPRGAGQ